MQISITYAIRVWAYFTEEQEADRVLVEDTTQAAWAATRTKRTYLAAQFRRLTTRLGKRRALVAVGHSILVIAWHLLSKQASYQEWGRDDVDRCDAQAYRLKRIRKLEALGLKVAVEPATSISEASSSFS
jgi:transposase